VERLFTREESRDVDRAAMDELGIVSLVLMENAGRGATEARPMRFATGSASASSASCWSVGPVRMVATPGWSRGV